MKQNEVGCCEMLRLAACCCFLKFLSGYQSDTDWRESSSFWESPQAFLVESRRTSGNRLGRVQREIFVPLVKKCQISSISYFGNSAQIIKKTKKQYGC